MEGLADCWRSPIEFVSRQWPALFGQMHADLVGAAGFQVNDRNCDPGVSRGFGPTEE